MALFASRVAGAWAVVLPILAVTGGLAAAGCIALAGSLAAPGAGAIAAGIAAVLAAGRSAPRSRSACPRSSARAGPVIGIMLAFYLAVQNLLLAMGFLGGVRQIVPDVAIGGSATSSRPRTCKIGLGAAILVLIAWSAVTSGSAHGAPGPARSDPRGTGPGIRSTACPRPFAGGWATRRPAWST